MDISQDHLEDFKDKYWPQHKFKVTQQNNRGEEVTYWQNVRDLKTSLKNVIHDEFKHGLQELLNFERTTQSNT